MLKILIYGWILTILLLLFVDGRKGVALFIPYIILMPFFTPTTLYVLAFLVYCFAKYIKRELNEIDIEPIKPFLLFFLFFACLIPFQNYTPKGVQISFWVDDFIATLTLPIMVWWEIRADGTAYLLYRKVIVGCIAVVSIYGLFLTLMPGNNPYLFFLMDSIGLDGAQDLQSYTEAGDGRLFGRISSVFIHPMTFGLFLGLSLTYWLSVSCRHNLNNFYVIIVLLVLNILFCGVRSAIVALIVVAIAYFLLVVKLRLSFNVILLLSLAIFLVLQSSYLSTYIGSIFGGSSDEVSGSSLEMRLIQYAGCLSEFQDSPLFGKGYAWHKYYLDVYGDHPILFAFESLVYVILCDGGLIGCLIWIILIIGVWRNAKRNLGEDYSFIIMLLSFYVSYSCITGEYGYMKFFMLFYILLYYDRILGEEGYEKLIEQVVEPEEIENNYG